MEQCEVAPGPKTAWRASVPWPPTALLPGRPQQWASLRLAAGAMGRQGPNLHTSFSLLDMSAASVALA